MAFIWSILDRRQQDIGAGINYQVHNPRRYHDDAMVYLFDSRLEISGTCTYPDKRAGEEYTITVYGDGRRADQFLMTLSQCHARGENGESLYRKVRGQEVPVYDIPNGIGILSRNRGTKTWNGWVWVPPRTVTDMLTLVPNVRPLFLGIHECREGRDRRIVDLNLQTNDPAEE